MLNYLSNIPLAVGAAGLACVAAGPGCVAAAEGVLGVGAATNTACGGDMCASEAEGPMAVFRVWGGKAGPNGHSWTDIDPRTITDYRNFSGLPDGNSGQFLSVGRLINDVGVKFRAALPLDGNIGGLSEVLVPNPETQIIIDSIINLIPRY